MEVINHAEIRHERHERHECNANANNDNQQAIHRTPQIHMVAAQGLLRLLSLGRITSTHLRSYSPYIGSGTAECHQVIDVTVRDTRQNPSEHGNIK
jgi:hypothetical protein